MTQTKNIGLAILGMAVIGLNFGLWMDNIFAGLTAAMVTYYAFMFRYDTD